MRRLIWLPLGGFLLIAGAAIAAAAPTVTPTSNAALADSASPTPAAATAPVAGQGDQQGEQPPFIGGDHEGLLTQVLADLVDKNVINEDQSNAITQALKDKAAALQTQAEQRRALLKSFIQDGVITQAEIDQLPADDPFRQAFDSIAQNGQINVDQLRGLGPGFGHGRGHAFGPGMPGPWNQPQTNDSTPDTTSGAAT